MVLYTSFYSVYVLCLQGAVNVFVLLALLVAADRVLNLTKYLVIKARAKLTGRTPQLSWYFKPLPEVEDLYPKVRGGKMEGPGGHRGAARAPKARSCRTASIIR